MTAQRLHPRRDNRPARNRPSQCRARARCGCRTGIHGRSHPQMAGTGLCRCRPHRRFWRPQAERLIVRTAFARLQACRRQKRPATSTPAIAASTAIWRERSALRATVFDGRLKRSCRYIRGNIRYGQRVSDACSLTASWTASSKPAEGTYGWVNQSAKD